MLPEVVREAARRFGSTAAFVEADGTPLGYDDLDRRSDALAASLGAAGIGPGAVVALTLPSTTAYVVAYLGAAKAGAVTAGVNPRLTDHEQGACLDVVDPALVVSSADEVARLVADGAGAGREVPVLTDDPDRPVVVVFTSGTTGLPRGATFTNRQLAAITRIDVADRWGDGSPLPMLAGTQFAHIGFTTKLAWYLRLGSTTHLLERWRAADVLDLAERISLPMLGGVSAQIALLLRDPRFDERDLSSVRQLVVGGGPSPPALVAEARRRFGADYSIRYSSTESGGVGTGTAFDADEHEALHTVGRPRGEIEVEIRDESGTCLPDGEVGHVHLRSGAVMSGYWGDPEATAVALPGEGWLRTGDLGSVDPTGCLVLAGRTGEMFIRGGYNVYPMEVEAVLGQHPAVAQVAVVPRTDPVMGERGVAAIVPVAGGPAPSLADLRAFAGDRLASHKLPDDVVAVAELPLTAMQKIDRKALAALVTEV